MTSYDEARELYVAIKAVFGTADGQKVLAHLIDEYNLMRPHRVFVPGDPGATQYHLGMQHCPAALVHVVDTDLEDLLATYRRPEAEAANHLFEKTDGQTEIFA